VRLATVGCQASESSYSNSTGKATRIVVRKETLRTVGNTKTTACCEAIITTQLPHKKYEKMSKFPSNVFKSSRKSTNIHFIDCCLALASIRITKLHSCLPETNRFNDCFLGLHVAQKRL